MNEDCMHTILSLVSIGNIEVDEDGHLYRLVTEQCVECGEHFVYKSYQADEVEE